MRINPEEMTALLWQLGPALMPAFSELPRQGQEVLLEDLRLRLEPILASLPELTSEEELRGQKEFFRRAARADFRRKLEASALFSHAATAMIEEELDQAPEFVDGYAYFLSELTCAALALLAERANPLEDYLEALPSLDLDRELALLLGDQD